MTPSYLKNLGQLSFVFCKHSKSWAVVCYELTRIRVVGGVYATANTTSLQGGREEDRRKGREGEGETERCECVCDFTLYTQQLKNYFKDKTIGNSMFSTEVENIVIAHRVSGRYRLADNQSGVQSAPFFQPATLQVVYTPQVASHT